MNRFTIISLGILFLNFSPTFPNDATSDPIQLNLNQGDQFTYTLKSTTSFINKLSGTERLINSWESFSKLKFKVEDIPKPGCYILAYEKHFTIVNSRSHESSHTSDTRFPGYGKDYEDMASSFLNTVIYKIQFCPAKNKMEIINIEHIRKELIKYLESRGVSKEINTSNATNKVLNEESILSEIDFLNFYPPENRTQNWEIRHLDGYIESFKNSRTNDSTVFLLSEIPDYENKSYNRYVSHSRSHLKKNMMVHTETGLILKAESYSILTDENIETNKIYRKRPDVTDYKIEVELTEFSKWQGPTTLSGKINRENVSSLCLVSKSNLIGSDEDFEPIEINDDGTFSIQLNIDDPRRYRLYFIENFPTKNNHCAQLFVEPGDSIFISSIEDGSQDTVIFSGHGYQNSEFLNQHSFSKYLGIPFRLVYPVHLPIEDHLSYHEKIKSDASRTIQLLELKKQVLTADFYNYMLSEIQSINLMVESTQLWHNHLKNPRDLDQTKDYKGLLKLPDHPKYIHYGNLEQYASYLEKYSLFRFFQFQTVNEGRMKFSTDRRSQFEFSKLLLNGFPLYLDLGNQLEWFLNIPVVPYDANDEFFRDFLESCNNEQAREYFLERYSYYTKLKQGNPSPVMDLTDINGEILNWGKTKGKVVVLMLYKAGGREHQFCEDLYEDYGKKPDDVVIMRISPDNSYTSWRNFNIRYSEKNYQFYFEDGEYEFNDRFLFSFNSNPKYLVIGRDGNIFQNVSQVTNLKGAIRSALNQEPPPGKAFIETMFVRILFGIVIGMILSFSLYRLIIYRRLKKKALIQKMTELEQRALKAQLNPHFLFNCLNSIQHLIRSNKRNEADKYLTTFATLIRQMLSNSEKEGVSVSEELESLKNYVELEQMRFNFEYEIDIDAEIDIYNTMIPTMLLQPVVENAILHGLDQKAGLKKLKIQAVVLNNYIQFTVDDNGIGRSVSSPTHLGHESKGLKLIESRISLLNKTGAGIYHFNIIDKKDDAGKALGTTVVIMLPDENE